MATTSPVTATVTQLPESRVRVEAEVPAAEVERRLAQAARQLARNLRVPGFRAGKAPPPVVIQRIGRAAVLDEAVRDSLGSWYTAAVDAAHIVPVGEPDLDIGDLPREGEPLRFSIEIGVRPTAELGEYKGVEVGRRAVEISEEEIGAELDRLRERSAKLDTVERAAEQGDFVVMDFVGQVDGEPFAGGEGRDQMVELGSGRLVPGFEDQLVGAAAGDERTVNIGFPEDYPADELAGKPAEFAVTVKEIKSKQLPELDDELAAEAGFDTLDELREDISARLAESEAARIEGEFREAVLDSAVQAARVSVPEPLVEARSRELWDQMMHSLSHQGISKEAYLRVSGRSEDEIVSGGLDDARQSLEREAVLAAIVEAEGIDPPEEEVVEALTRAAGGRAPNRKALDRLRASGRLEAVKEDVAQRRALDLITESAKPITVEQAKARDKLWTPGQERPEGASQLWTPGS